jgi:hypothetical protein
MKKSEQKQFDRRFDISTLKGLKQAERFKALLENKGLSVKTEPYGLDGVRITGK